jgi:hypothetical protein
MADPDEVTAVWETLPKMEQRALADLLSSGGRMPWRTFTRRWGEVRTMGPARLDRERPWEQPVSSAEALWYRGMFFRDLEEDRDGLREVAVVPNELRRALPSPPSPALRPSAAPAPRYPYPASDALLDDGCTLLAYLQNHQVKPDTERKWPAQHEAALLRRLRDPAQCRLALLRHLARRLGWLYTVSSGHLRPEPESATHWLQAPAQEQRQALAAAWRDDPTWNDLWRVPSLRADDTGSWYNDPLRARRAILHHLTACQVGSWYSLDDFAAAVKECDPDFQRPDGDYDSWYIRDAFTGEYLSGFDSWEAVEGALIRYLITRPMAWLGLMDLGAERETGPVVTFRLSNAGATFLELMEPQPVAESSPLTVRSDLTILIPPARRYERFQLSRVADWVHTGDPYVYRLTPASLTRARRQSISTQRVWDFLESESQEQLPGSLRRALTRWEERGAEIQLERGVLLRVRDERLLRRLTKSPATRRFVAEVIGPKAALIAPADWPRLARALVEEGLLPDVLGLGEECEI